MIRNIVFDMGMVLMDYHPLAASRAAAPDEESAQKVYEALFHCPEWLMTDAGTRTMAQLEAAAIDNLDAPALRALIPPLIAGMPWNVLSPIPGAAEMVDAVLARGFGVYLLSNASEMVSNHPDVIPGIEKFHGVVISAKEKLVKPDAAIYRRLTDRFGLDPAQCLFVDDMPANVAGAQAVGWQGYVHDGDTAKLAAMLQALPNP